MTARSTESSGPASRAAIRAYQSGRGLVADGFAGLQLLETLAERLKLADVDRNDDAAAISASASSSPSRSRPRCVRARGAGAIVGGEIVVAQNNYGPGGFFRRLFGGNRRQQQRAAARSPSSSFPASRSRSRRCAKPRRERRARTAAPQPREVAAVEKAPNAKRALVIGDFMAGALAKGLAEAYRENANVVVIDASSGSSGLVRNDYYDWPAKVPELVAEQKPDAILVMIGGNDRQTMQTRRARRRSAATPGAPPIRRASPRWPMR